MFNNKKIKKLEDKVDLLRRNLEVMENKYWRLNTKLWDLMQFLGIEEVTINAVPELHIMRKKKIQKNK